MSYISFQTSNDRVDVPGAERAAMDEHLTNIGLGAAEAFIKQSGTVHEAIIDRCSGRHGSLDGASWLPG